MEYIYSALRAQLGARDGASTLEILGLFWLRRATPPLERDSAVPLGPQLRCRTQRAMQMLEDLDQNAAYGWTPRVQSFLTRGLLPPPADALKAEVRGRMRAPLSLSLIHI